MPSLRDLARLGTITMLFASLAVWTSGLWPFLLGPFVFAAWGAGWLFCISPDHDAKYARLAAKLRALEDAIKTEPAPKVDHPKMSFKLAIPEQEAKSA